MMKSRKVIESGVVTAALAITAVAAAVSGDVRDTSQSSKQANNETVFLADHEGGNAKEKIAVADSGSKETAADVSVHPMVTAEYEVEHMSDTVGAQSAWITTGTIQETFLNQISMAAEEQKREKDTKETSAWDGKLLANVENNVNVRANASEDADIVGRMYKGSAAEVLEKGEEWTKIKSGNVEGYVNNEYCVFDEEAEKLADKVCPTYATSTASGLRVREKASTEAKIFTVLEKGQKLTVDTDAKEADGWIAVSYEGNTAYISAEYAKVKQNVKQAMTLEEEQKMIEEEEAKKRAEEEKKRLAAQAAASESSTKGSVSREKDNGIGSTVDDVTLLAALIYCEAGAEPYEGQLAVGAVVVNRVQSSAYPDTISGVIYQKGQFGPASSGKLARTLAKGNFDKCYKAAREALSGVDNTGGAIGFHAGKGSGTVIGNQTFF